jgi:hypothetical protein
MAFEYYTNYGSFLRKDFKYPEYDYNLDPKVFEFGPPFYNDKTSAIWVGTDPVNYAYIELTNNTSLEMGHTYGELTNIEVNSALTEFNGHVNIDGGLFITGILRIGSNTIVLDGNSNVISVGTGVSIVGSGTTYIKNDGYLVNLGISSFYSNSTFSDDVFVGDSIVISGISSQISVGSGVTIGLDFIHNEGRLDNYDDGHFYSDLYVDGDLSIEKEDDIVIRENKVDIHDEDVRGVIQENIEIGIEDGDEVTLKDLNRVKKEVRLISKFIETLNIPSFKTNPAEGLNPGKKYNQCSITDIPHEYRNEYGTNDISLMVNKNNGKSYELHYLVEYNKKYNKVSSFFYDFKANKAYDSVGYDSDIPWDNYSSFMH